MSVKREGEGEGEEMWYNVGEEEEEEWMGFSDGK
jgi:hypothetical protein